ncbi:MAG: hypothetical protein WC530_05430 [Candidatus Omnitrophota bacterium]|jgi:hypothetical protein
MDVMPVKRLFAVFSFLIIMFTASPILLKSETPEAGVDISPGLLNLAVPEKIGKVQERFTGSSTRTIIQIQDVHAHATAQQNIAAILERLRMVFGIEKAALEGAWTSTSLPKSHTIPTSREKQLLAGTLLDDDRISGPVYAAIMSSKPIMLIGIEDKTFYEKNRTLFLTHLGKVKEIDGKLRTYEASLKESQKSTWGPELLTFGNAFGKFREISDLGKFFPVLLKTAETQNAGTSDLDQITLLRSIMVLEKSFVKERLENEIEQIIKKYRDRPWTLEELIRGGKIPPEEIGLYPEIKKLTLLYKMRDQLSLQNLTDQIGVLTSRILEKLVKVSKERALWERTERFCLSKKILLLQATPADLKAYKGEKTLLESELTGTGLSETLALSADFYDTVEKRDEIFFDKIMNDPSLAGDVAIVTGGFHTDGLSQRFRAAGISYITITPELDGTAMNEKLYNARMADEGWEMAKDPQPKTSSVGRPPSSGSQTLSELRNAIAWIDDRFPESYEALLQTRDVREAKKFFLGGTIAVSRSAKISYLSREGRIVPEPKAGTAINVSKLRVSEFMARPRPEQLKAVRSWLAQGAERREKAMLVSSISILARVLLEKEAVKLLEEAISNGDTIALAQDVPVTKTPEILSLMRGVDRFEATDIAMLVKKTPRFQRLAKKRPFAIMENGHPGGTYVVLPEKPVSLVLFRIITLNPSLYQAAKDPAFLALLQDLVAEILSQEITRKSA